MTIHNHLAKPTLAAMWQAIRHFVGHSTRDNRGAAGVEFAIFAPALVVMVVCTADIGLGIYCKMRVQNAAQFGTQYAVAHGFDTTSITNAMINNTSVAGLSVTPAPYQFCGCATSTGIGTIDCNSPCSDGSSAGVYVTVATQGTYNTIVPYPLIPDTYTFATQATVRIQ